MRILFLSTMFPDGEHPSRGIYNYELCRALARDHEIHVICPRPWPEMVRSRLNRQRRREDPVTAAAGFGCSRPGYWYPPKMLRTRYGAFLWQSIRGTVQRLEKDFRPDAILSYWAHPDGEAAQCAAREADVPHAVIVGGSDVLLLPKCRARGARVKQVLADSDAVIAVSEGLRQSVIKLGTPAETVHTIRQGVDPERFHPDADDGMRHRFDLPGDRPVLLWVGRMVGVKGLDVLIDSCARLRSSGRSFLLCLIGGGPDQPAVEQLVEERGLTDSVRFVGTVGHDALPHWYRAADVTLLSSWSEGLPNVLRESLACGTPFVSTDVGSIGEIADDRFAVLVKSGDAAGLADGIRDVLDGARRAAARAYVARTWSDCASDVAGLFEQLRSARSARREQPVARRDRERATAGV